MGIDKQSEIAANLQIGPTTLGMVRIYVEADGVELPLDFDPDEADEIAEELRIAAASARKLSSDATKGAGTKGAGAGTKNAGPKNAGPKNADAGGTTGKNRGTPPRQR